MYFRQTRSVSYPIRTAVMGVGRWGRNLLRVLTSMEEIDLRWYADPDPVARSAAQEIAPQAKATSDIFATLGEVELVVVATPARDHGYQVLALLEAGKHVFVEKPMALDTATAVEIARKAALFGATMMVGHQLLYHAGFTALEALVREGALGSLLELRAVRAGAVDLKREPDVVFAYGPHDAALVLALAGELPKKIVAKGDRLGKAGQWIDVELNLDFASGVHAMIRLDGRPVARERRLVVVGTKRTAVLDDVIPPGRLFLQDGAVSWPTDAQLASARLLAVPPTEPLVAECLELVRVLSTGAEPRTGHNHAVAVTQLLERAITALSSAHP